MSRVLIVEDDPLIRNFLIKVLDVEGYEVRAASNGQHALDILVDWHPGVILLDLMMPILDGWAFRAEQLRVADLARIPVIIGSTLQDAQDQAFALEAAACLPKPYDIDELLETVRSLVAAA